MEQTTHYEETTKVVQDQPMVTDTNVTTKKGKTKKNKHAKKTTTTDQYGPRKTFGTRVKEFFTGQSKDQGIIYQNGLPIAGLNGPIVQPMGAPIRQPAEIHPVATVNTTPVTVNEIPGQHIRGPTTTTYGPAPPLEPGMGEGIAKTTTTTEYIQPGLEVVQPMNALAQPTGLGAIVQPAGVIIAGKDKRVGLREGYLKDQTVHAFPHERVKQDKHQKRDKHAHEEIYTNTTTEEILPPPQPIVQPVSTVPVEPAPVIFTGPAQVLPQTGKHTTDKHAKKEHRKEEKIRDRDLYEQQGGYTNVDQQVLRPNTYMQPTVLEQQPMPVTVLGPGQPGYIAPTGIQTGAPMGGPLWEQEQITHTQMHHLDKDATRNDRHIQEHYHDQTIRDTNLRGQGLPQTQVVTQQPVVLQQPGMAPSNQPVVRNHQQVPMTSQSGLQQGGLFQNDTARPVQTFTPVIQENQPLSETPILNQAAMEQQAFAPTGMRTKEGLVQPHPVTGKAGQQTANMGTKQTYPVGYEERKETVVQKDVKY